MSNSAYGSRPDNLLDLVGELEQLPEPARIQRLDELRLDPKERHLVERCLQLAGRAQSFMDRPPAPVGDVGRLLISADETAGPRDSTAGQSDPHAPAPPPGCSPPRIPGYELKECVGTGGMGSVFRAVQLATRREVALKVMGSVLIGSGRVRARFDREVQITASLEHPHIARVYDSGVFGGVYFYAMELIDGVHLDRFVEDNRLNRRQILELMRTVCRAVEHAHQNGVIHCDLKPGNILVTRDGQPRLMDFGLAKALSDAGAEVSVSRDGEVAGTPAYMSPEQAAGRGGRLDTRSDVFALGVILFRLLTGRSPHDLSGSRMELLRRISEADVVVPREPSLGSELEALLLKALARDPGQRYGTAGGMASDLDRYLCGEPLVAKRPTLTYVLRKRLRRHWPVAAAVAVMALVVGGGLAADAARVRRERANAVAGWKAADDRGKAEHDQRLLSDRRLAESLVAQADALAAGGRWAAAKQRYLQARQGLVRLGASPLPADLGLSLAYQAIPEPLATARIVKDDRTAVAFSPDCRSVLYARPDGRLELKDLLAGTVLRTFSGFAGRPSPGRDADGGWGGAVRILLLSADGARAVSCNTDGEIKAWDTTTATELASYTDPDAVPVPPTQLPGGGLSSDSGNWIQTAAMSPDGNVVVYGGSFGLKRWEFGSGAESIRKLSEEPERSVQSAVITANGERVVYLASFTLLCRELATGKLLSSVRPGTSNHHSMVLSPDGRTAAGEFRGDVVTFNVATGRRLATMRGHAADVTSLCYFPDGKLLLTGARDRSVRVWEAWSGTEVRNLGDQLGPVSDVKVSSDGRAAAVRVGNDVTLFPLAEGSELLTLSGPDPAAQLHNPIDAGPGASVAFALGGRLALHAGPGRTVRVSDVSTGLELQRFELPSPILSRVTFSRDGRLALTAGAELELWEVLGGRRLQRLARNASGDRLSGATISDDGSVVICASSPQGEDDAGLSVFDVASGNETHAFDTRSGIDTDGLHLLSGETPISLMRDGRTVMVPRGFNSFVGFWDIRTGQNQRQFQAPLGSITSMDIAADGEHAVFGLSDGGVDVWHLAEGRQVAQLGHHDFVVTSVALSPDGGIAASGGSNGTVKLWDVVGRAELRELDGRAGAVSSVRLSPSGDSLLFGCADGTARLWRYGRAAGYQDLLGRLRLATERLRRNPNDAEAVSVLGDWAVFRGQWGLAWEYLELVRQNGGSVPSSLLSLCYWLDGRTADARREIRQALTSSPNPAEHAHLALIHGFVERGGDPTIRTDPDIAEPPDDSTAMEARLRDLLPRLGSDDVADRERAQAELASLGPTADPHLRRALTAGDPPPAPVARSRIQRVLDAREAHRRTGPVRVTLRFQNGDVGPREVFAELARQSGILLAPSTAGMLADPAVAGAGRGAVELSDTPAWAAIGALCDRYELTVHGLDREGRLLVGRPAPGEVPAAFASDGAFAMTIHRVEVTDSRAIDLASAPGPDAPRPINVNREANQPAPYRLFAFAWSEPRVRPIAWFLDEVAAEYEQPRTGAAREARGEQQGESVRNPPPVGPLGGNPGRGGRVNNPSDSIVAVPADPNRLGADATQPRLLKRLTLRTRFLIERGERRKVELNNVMDVSDHELSVLGVPVVIEDVNHIAGDEYGLRFTARRDDRSPEEWSQFTSILEQFPPRLVDTEGRALIFRGGGSSYTPDKMTVTTTMCRELPERSGDDGADHEDAALGPPAKLVWEFPTDVDQVPATLEFTDVPLP